MDWSSLITAISNVGFPIAMCVLLSLYIKDSDKRHDEEVNNLRKALENNTLVMQQLVDKFND